MHRRTISIALSAVLVGMALAGCANNGGTPTTTTTTSPTGGITAPSIGTPTPPTGGVNASGPCPVPGAGISAPLPNTDRANPGTSSTPKDVHVVFTGAGEAESLDPGYDYESAGGQILKAVYEKLYDYDNASAVKLKPVLATDFPTCSADQTELTIKLRQGVKFHSGKTMTAKDVKYSLDRIILMNDPDGPAVIYYQSIKGGPEYAAIDVTEVTQADRDKYLAAKGVEIVDDYTVKIRLNYPDPSFLYRLAFSGASIVSMDTFCANKDADIGQDCLPVPGKTRHAWADTHEDGTGPFMLDHWNQGTELVLKRFEDYWGQKPALKNVIIKNVDDFNTRLTALKSGEADEIYVPVDHAPDVQGLSGVEIMEDPSWSVSFIGFNQKFCGGPGTNGFDDCMRDNADAVPKGANGQADPLFFSDIHMRKAWAYIFDYDTYLNNIVGGHGKLLDGVLPEGIFGYDASIDGPRRNVELAKQEYAQSNHSDGFTVTIFYNTGNTVREKTAELLAQNLEELGSNIHVEAKGLDFSTAFLPKQRARALPVFYLGWLPDYAFPDNYVVPFAHSVDGVYAKRISYANPTIDTLVNEMLKTTDQTKLTQGYSQIVKTLNDDFAYLWLAQANNYHVQRDWVNGYYYNPMHSGAPNTGDFTTISKV